MRPLFALVFATLLGLAIGYEKGKEYLHKDEGYIYSHLPNTKPQYAGIAFIADVRIQVQNENEYFIKIENPKIDMVNALIENTFEKYPFEYKETPALTEALSKPFKVHIQHGKIFQYYISEEESNSSINIKKSFLNLLQLCIHHHDTAHSHISNDENFFVIPEKGTFGECDTSYSIKSEPTVANSQKVLNVTKIRNYDKCTKRPHMDLFLTWPGIPCDDCDHSVRKEVMQATAFYDYNLKGTRDSYVIEKVTQKEYRQSSPFGRNGQTIRFVSRRTLELYQTKDITEPIKVPDNVAPETDLTRIPLKKHEFFDNIDLRKAHYLHDIFRYQTPVDQVTGLFEEVVSDYANIDPNPSESTSPAKFGEIVDSLSTLDYDEIEKVYKTVWEKGQNYRKVFLDALSSSATNPAFVLAKSLIEQKKVDDVYPAYTFLQRLSIHIKETTETLLNEYYQLCIGNTVQQSKDLKKSCYLSFGAVVYSECVEKYFIHNAHRNQHHHHHKITPKIADLSKHHCSPEISDKYFKLLVKPENEVSSEKDILLLIKTTENFRSKEGVKFLKKYIESGNKQYIRSSAIWGLVDSAKYYPKEIQAIVAPIFFNKSEENELRIAAFSVWLKTDISLSHLQLIAKHLMTEQNRHIVTFAYSAIKSFSDLKAPCFNKWARNSKAVLWLYKIAFDKIGGKKKYGDSRLKVEDIQNLDHHFGTTYGFLMASNAHSYAPTTLVFNTLEHFAGRMYSHFGVSINTYGVDKVFNRMFGRKGIYWRKTSFFDIFKKRTARDASSVDSEIKKIDKSLPIKARDFEDVFIQYSLKYRGSTVWYCDTSEELFSGFLKDGTVNIPDIQKLMEKTIGGKELNTFYEKSNNLYMGFSENGLTYYHHHKEITRINFENNKFKFNVSPALFSEDRENKAPTELLVSADAKYQRQTDSHFTGGFVLPIANRKVGSGYYLRTIVTMPINGEISYKYDDKKITIKRIPKAYDLIYEKMIPFTFIDSYSNKVPMLNEPTFKPIYNDANLKKIERSYLQNYFGYGIKVDMRMPEIDREKLYKFYAEKSFMERLITYKYAFYSGKPYENRISLAPADTNPSTELKVSWTWKDEEEDNEIADFSYNEDSAFKDYTARADRSPENHVLKMEIIGDGNIQRNVYADIRYSHSRNRLFHKLNFNYDRSPINDNGFKVCAVSSMIFPEYDEEKFAKLETLEMDHTVNLTGKIAFGENCENNAKITLKAQMSQSDEQKRLQRSRETIHADTPNPYASSYYYCKNLHKFKWNAYPFCAYYLYDISQMRKLVAAIDYENIPERLSNYTFKLLRANSYKRFPYVDVKMKNGQSGPPGHVNYESTASVLKPQVTYKIDAPHFTAIYRNVPMSPYLSPVFTFSLHPFKYFEVGNEQKRFCIIQDKTVRTFDNVTYSLPPIDDNCETVVAKDCSPENNFMVLSAKVKDKWRFKVFFSNKFKIQLIPKDDGMDVEVNGKKIVVTKEEPYIHTFKHGNREIEIFSVDFNGIIYKITSEKFGILMSTDGIGYGVQITRYYTGKTCGLCGDSNDNGYSEFKGPNNNVFKSSNAFAYSYVIPDDKCSPPSGANENELFFK